MNKGRHIFNRIIDLSDHNTRNKKARMMVAEVAGTETVGMMEPHGVTAEVE